MNPDVGSLYLGTLLFKFEWTDKNKFPEPKRQESRSETLKGKTSEFEGVVRIRKPENRA